MADVVVLKGGKVIPKLQIESFSPTKVTCADNKTFAVTDVETVRFETFEVAPKWSGVILTDGCRIGGVVRRTGPTDVVFRSVAFGEITLRRADIACMYFAPTTVDDMKQAGAPPSGQCTILRRDGKVLTGKLMWADLKSVGALVGKSLEKIPSAEVKALVFLAPTLTDNVVLRSNDRLAGISVADDGKIESIVAGANVAVPLKALLSVKMTNALKSRE